MVARPEVEVFSALRLSHDTVRATIASEAAMTEMDLDIFIINRLNVREVLIHVR